jgi:FtsP/CotA-like multicopper oxidase with cupredoxin domain
MIGRTLYAAPLLTLCLIGLTASPVVRLPEVVPNDNRKPAGTLRGDTLQLDLEVRMGTWRPESDSGPAIEVAAFAERGKAPQIPGPLIRVPTGTTIVAKITNALTDSTISIHGLMTRPAEAWDSVLLRPGETKEIRFAAGAPGTYLYRAMLGKHSIDRRFSNEREQVAGAFVVDPAGGSPPDRILMINVWGNRVDSVNWNNIDYRNALTINGLSWPYTERFDAMVGDTVRWRLINASGRTHPMHLHGFYFNIEARGTGLADQSFGPANRRAAVTEVMPPYVSLGMTFVPDRPGNWLLHCHVGFHVTPHARLDKPPADGHDNLAHDPGRHMAGLVVGISVRPRTGEHPAARTNPARLRLFAQEGARRLRSPRALSFVLQEGAAAPRPDSVLIPSSLLVLTRGRPTDITVINRLKEPTAVHWHGVELESYSDGVAGWSGDAANPAPSIMPGDSFVAHLTLPRAGTFIYHTHLNDLEQVSAGLYGAIVVLERGQHFDPARDHVFIMGWDGALDPIRSVVNGGATEPLQLAAGVTHRFRFVNIGVAVPAIFSILRDTTVMRWRKVAKDGADLPAVQAVMAPARQAVNVGETYDFEITLEPGEYLLTNVWNNVPQPARRLIVR